MYWKRFWTISRLQAVTFHYAPLAGKRNKGQCRLLKSFAFKSNSQWRQMEINRWSGFSLFTTFCGAVNSNSNEFLYDLTNLHSLNGWPESRLVRVSLSMTLFQHLSINGNLLLCTLVHSRHFCRKYPLTKIINRIAPTTDIRWVSFMEFIRIYMVVDWFIDQIFRHVWEPALPDFCLQQTLKYCTTTPPPPTPASLRQLFSRHHALSRSFPHNSLHHLQIPWSCISTPFVSNGTNSSYD